MKKLTFHDIALILLLIYPTFYHYIIFVLFLLLYILKTKKLKMDFFYLPILIIGIMSAVLRLNNNSNFRNIIRDFYYFSIGIVYIMSGYCLGNIYEDKRKLLKNLFIVENIRIFITLSYLIINIILKKINLDYEQIRYSISLDIEIIAITTAILLTFGKNQMLDLFKRKYIYIFTILNILALLISFSRTGYIIFLIMLVALNIDIFKKDLIIKLLKGMFVFGIVTIILLLIPNSFIKPFINKFKNSMTEISIEHDWDDINITQNWRGYELYEALNTFKNGTGSEKVFGYGFGKLINVRLSELVGIPKKDGGITILHNGYAMLLVKTGLVGLILFIIWLMNLLISGIKRKNSIYGRAMIGIVFIILFDTYIVSGLFKADVSLTFTITIGIIEYMMDNKNKVDLISKE